MRHRLGQRRKDGYSHPVDEQHTVEPFPAGDDGRRIVPPDYSAYRVGALLFRARPVAQTKHDQRQPGRPSE